MKDIKNIQVWLNTQLEIFKGFEEFKIKPPYPIPKYEIPKEVFKNKHLLNGLGYLLQIKKDYCYLIPINVKQKQLQITWESFNEKDKDGFLTVVGCGSLPILCMLCYLFIAPEDFGFVLAFNSIYFGGFYIPVLLCELWVLKSNLIKNLARNTLSNSQQTKALEERKGGQDHRATLKNCKEAQKCIERMKQKEKLYRSCKDCRYYSDYNCTQTTEGILACSNKTLSEKQDLLQRRLDRVIEANKTCEKILKKVEKGSTYLDAVKSEKVEIESYPMKTYLL